MRTSKQYDKSEIIASPCTIGYQNPISVCGFLFLLISRSHQVHQSSSLVLHGFYNSGHFFKSLKWFQYDANIIVQPPNSQCKLCTKIANIALSSSPEKSGVDSYISYYI